MSAPINLSRRRFLRDASITTGVLIVGSAIPWRMGLADDTDVLDSGVLVSVGADGRVTLRFTWNELGQGAMTSLALVTAEELCVAPAAVDVVTPTWEMKYGFAATGRRLRTLPIEERLHG